MQGRLVIEESEDEGRRLVAQSPLVAAVLRVLCKNCHDLLTMPDGACLRGQLRPCPIGPASLLLLSLSPCEVGRKARRLSGLCSFNRLDPFRM